VVSTKSGGQKIAKGSASRRPRFFSMPSAPRRATSSATKKPASTKNTGIRKLWMKSSSSRPPAKSAGRARAAANRR
jgi:hypothetical protein